MKAIFKEIQMDQSRRFFAGRVAGFTACILLVAAGFSASAAELPHVLLKTSMGDITLELDAQKAPQSVENFLKYVKNGHYKGTIFHRVIDGFMIQGGGFDKNMVQKPTEAPIKNEGRNGLKNMPYSIAMARTGDPDSATAQFFINVNDNAALDYPSRDGFGYAVFGHVIAGQDVVDKIRKVATTSVGGYQDVPRAAVVIESASIVK
jgi:peptidyl-prolyl cis-trans isomerase A (cyclophilin A)